MNITLTREERHLRALAQLADDTGLVTLTECDVCGNIKWAGTATGEPKGFKVIPLEGTVMRKEEEC